MPPANPLDNYSLPSQSTAATQEQPTTAPSKNPLDNYSLNQDKSLDKTKEDASNPLDNYKLPSDVPTNPALQNAVNKAQGTSSNDNILKKGWSQLVAAGAAAKAIGEVYINPDPSGLLKNKSTVEKLSTIPPSLDPMPLTEDIHPKSTVGKVALTGAKAMADVWDAVVNPMNAGLFMASLAAPEVAVALAGPKALEVAKTISVLASAGFTANNLSHLEQMYPEFTKAIANHDTEKAIELAASGLVLAGFSGLGLHEAFYGDYDPKPTIANKAGGIVNMVNKQHTQEAYELIKSHKDISEEKLNALQMVGEARVEHYFTGKPINDILDDYIERGKTNPKITDKSLRKQYVKTVKLARKGNFTPEELKTVDTVFDFLREKGKARLTALGMLQDWNPTGAAPQTPGGVSPRSFRDENGNPDPLTTTTADQQPKTLNTQETLELNRKGDPNFAKLPVEEQTRRAKLDADRQAEQVKIALDYLNSLPLEEKITPEKDDTQASKILASDDRNPADRTREIEVHRGRYEDAVDTANKAEARWQNGYRDWLKVRKPGEIEYPSDLEQIRSDYVKSHQDLVEATRNYKNAKYFAGNIGEVRQLPDGNIITYLNPKVIKEIAAIHGSRPGTVWLGFNQADISNTIRGIANSDVLDDATKNTVVKLLNEGRKQADQGRGTIVVSNELVNNSIGNHVSTLREELLHGYQRQLTTDNTMKTHLSPDDFTNLWNQIDTKTKSNLMNLGYQPDKVSYVIEVAAHIMKGRSGWQGELGMTPEQAADWIHSYFEAVERTHGNDALFNIQHIHGIAKDVRASFAKAAKDIPEVGDKVNAESETIKKAREAVAVGRESADQGTVGGVQGGGPGGDTGVTKEAAVGDPENAPWLPHTPWQHEVDEENPLIGKARDRLNAGGERPNHLAKRIFSNTIEGLEQGYKPVQRGFWYNRKYAFNIIDNAADYHLSIGREIGRKKFADFIKDAFGADGRPLVLPGGSINSIPNGPVQADSNGIMDHALTKAEVKELTDSGKLQEYLQSGAVYQSEDGTYKYNSTGYSNQTRSRYAVNHRWIGTRNPSRAEMEEHFHDYGDLGPEGRDVLLKAPVALHPEIADTARAVLDPKPSAVANIEVKGVPVGKAVLKVSTELKQTLLSASMFHWVQIAGRMAMSVDNPFHLEKWNLDGQTPQSIKQRKLIEYGSFQPGIEGQSKLFAEGSGGEGGILKLVPGINDLLAKNNRALFGPNGFIDRAKLTAGLEFVDRIQELHPDWDEGKVYTLAGELANNRFGGQNYLQLNRSKTAQDIMRLTLLAPDWFESNMRDTALAVKYPQLGGKDFARIALYNFTIAQTINKAWTGKVYMDHPFDVVSPDGKTLYSVRTLPNDQIHMLGDPAEFFADRLNPTTVRTAAETYTDIKQHKASLPQSMLDLFNNIVPLPGQGFAQQLEGDKSADWTKAAATALGVTTRVYHTPAETMGLKLRAETPYGGVDMTPEQLHQNHKIIELEDRLRKGDQSVIGELEKGVREGKYQPNIVNKVIKASKTDLITSLTKGRSLDQTLDMWALANNDEKRKMLPEILRQINNLGYVKNTEKYTSSELKQLYKRVANFYKEVNGSEDTTPQFTAPPSYNPLDNYTLQEQQQNPTKGSASTSYDEGPLAGQPVKGLLEKGNIDVNHRPSIANADGSHSSIFSATIALDNNDNVWEGKYEDAPKYALIPQIANGKFLTSDGKMPTTLEGRRQLEEASIKYYEKTHEHLGIFLSGQAADAYANKTHAYMNDGTAKKVYAPSY